MKAVLTFVAPALLLLTGCASQPAWVSAMPSAMCFTKADKSCLGELIAKNVSEVPAGNGRDQAVKMTKAVMAGAGIPDPKVLIELQAEREKSMCLRPEEGYFDAGKAVESAREKRFSVALESVASISEQDAKLFALRNIAILATRANDETATGKALNLLHDTDGTAYMDGLQERLVSLLVTGDLERARALQDALLSYYIGNPGHTMAVAQIAISYATTGHVVDANDFLQRAAEKVPDLRTEDLSKLLNIMVKASNGDYPPPQDFYDFSNDNVRLQAYVQLAVFYERSGQTGNSARIAGDMARFTQKSSFKVGRAESVAAMSRVLIEAM